MAGTQEETQPIWKMDRTVPPEVTVAEDAGAAADAADKVRMPGKDSSRYKAHIRGRKSRRMQERHRWLRYNRKAQVRRRRLRRTPVGINVEDSIRAGTRSVPMAVNRNMEDMPASSIRVRVHHARPDRCGQHAGRSIRMRNFIAHRWTTATALRRTAI